MTEPPPRDGADKRLAWRLCAEWAFVATIFGFLTYTYFYFRVAGYLPLPFFPDPNDVYADGYSTAWWAWNGHMYDEWKTVYPPFSFAFLKLISNHQCYFGDIPDARNCDWTLWWWMLGEYCVNGVLAYFTFRKIEKASAAPRALAFFMALPTIYSFEHLNLLVFTWTCLILTFSTLLRSARLKWFAMAIAINLKPYMLVLLLAQLLRGRWRWVEGTLILAIAIYLVSYVMVGGTPAEIWRNITIFATDPGRASTVNIMVYASSYTSMLAFMQSMTLPMTTFLGSRIIENSLLVIPNIVLAVNVLVLVTFVAIWLNPGAVPRPRSSTMALLLVQMNTEPGGYTIAATIFMIFLERFRGWRLGGAITLAYLQSIAMDYQLFPLGSSVSFGWFAKHNVMYYAGATVGPFLRPGALIATQVLLVSVTWSEVMKYRRGQFSRPIAGPAYPSFRSVRP